MYITFKLNFLCYVIHICVLRFLKYIGATHQLKSLLRKFRFFFLFMPAVYFHASWGSWGRDCGSRETLRVVPGQNMTVFTTNVSPARVTAPILSPGHLPWRTVLSLKVKTGLRWRGGRCSRGWRSSGETVEIVPVYNLALPITEGTIAPIVLSILTFVNVGVWRVILTIVLAAWWHRWGGRGRGTRVLTS